MDNRGNVVEVRNQSESIINIHWHFLPQASHRLFRNNQNVTSQLFEIQTKINSPLPLQYRHMLHVEPVLTRPDSTTFQLFQYQCYETNYKNICRTVIPLKLTLKILNLDLKMLHVESLETKYIKIVFELSRETMETQDFQQFIFEIEFKSLSESEIIQGHLPIVWEIRKLSLFELEEHPDTVYTESHSILTNMYLEKRFTDFEIKSGNLIIPCHRAVLASASIVLKNFVKNNVAIDVSCMMNENQTKAFVQYLYTSEKPDRIIFPLAKIDMVTNFFELRSLREFYTNQGPNIDDETYTESHYRLCKIYDEKLFHDYVIQKDSFTVSCHKAVLVAASKTFDGIICHNKEVFEADSMSVDTIRAFVRYIYTSQLPNWDSCDVFNLLEQATCFNICSLKEACNNIQSSAKKIGENDNVNPCLSIVYQEPVNSIKKPSAEEFQQLLTNNTIDKIPEITYDETVIQGDSDKPPQICGNSGEISTITSKFCENEDLNQSDTQDLEQPQTSRIKSKKTKRVANHQSPDLNKIYKKARVRYNPMKESVVMDNFPNVNDNTQPVELVCENKKIVGRYELRKSKVKSYKV